MTNTDPEKAYRSSPVAAWLAPKQVNRVAMIEALLLVSLTLAIGWLTMPDDPFMVHAPFPWLWLAPLLLTLRYGTLIALLTSGLLLGFWFLLQLFDDHAGTSFPSSFFLGGLIVTLVAGEFADIWSSRLRRVASVNAYQNETIQALTQRHYLLHLAYARLEQEMLVKPVTLRDALQRLRRLVVNHGGRDSLPSAQDFLNLLGHACRLTEASLHAVIDGKPQVEAAAQLGVTGPLGANDPLVVYALEQRQLSHVQLENVKADNSRYVIAGPLITSDGELVGLLAVESLPFLSLNEETLRFLAVLLGYYADAIKLSASIQQVLQQTSDCRLLFAGELVRLYRIHRDVRITSTLAALIVAPGPRQAEIVEEALRQARGADMSWEVPMDDSQCLLTLMPLSSQASFSGYIQRTERWLKDHGFADLGSAGVSLHHIAIDDTPPADLLRDFLQLCRDANALRANASKLAAAESEA